ncbi:MAG: translation elongation factor Ts [Candidatus Pacebacteria bacterium]|nr:translation elongation factor Ts [Candidatus Paceibacterota bacterium]
MKVNLGQLKKLRQKSGAGVMDCRRALTACEGRLKEALVWLKEKGIARAEKRADRQVKNGLIEAYSHSGGRIVAVVELLCETDFVARTPEFKELAHELAMQVAAMSPQNAEDLEKQPYIRDEKIRVGELLKEIIAKTGENIVLGRLIRLELGENNGN